MSFLQLYARLTRAYMLGKVAVLAVNLVCFPRLRPSEAAPLSRPRVSLLIPARDEALNLRGTLPGLLRQGADEVLVLDDQSSDGTSELARHLGATVLSGEALPPGWKGKPWACQQLAQAATGDILIFVDADVTWHPGALDAVLAELGRSGAELLSIWPRQDNRTLGERLITPLIDILLLSALPYPFLALPVPLLSVANGQVMVFRREAYRAMGEHRAVRAEVLEDVKFAQEVRRRGGRVALALARELISVRMYRSYPEARAGLTKNLLTLHASSRPVALFTLFAMLAAYTAPWLLRSLPNAGWLRLFGLLERPAVNWLAGRRRPADLAEGLLAPVFPLVMIPVYLGAMRRQVRWKGREYRQ